MLESKLKTIRTIYIVFVVIYAIVVFMGLFFTIAECLVFENIVSTVLAIINYARQIVAFVVFIYGLNSISRCINNPNYLETYMRKYNIWIVFILSALVTPFYLIVGVKTYKASQIYIASHIYTSSESEDGNMADIRSIDNNARIVYPLSKTKLILFIVLSIIIGIISTFGYFIGASIASMVHDNNSFYTIEKPTGEMPSIRLHYDNNETDLFDQSFNFNALDNYFGYNVFSSDDLTPDDMVKANSSLMAKKSNIPGFYITLRNNEKCKVKEMKIADVSIDYYVYDAPGLDNIPYKNINMDSYYIIINGNKIDKSIDYVIAKEILKSISNENCYFYENNYNDYNSLYINNQGNYSINLRFYTDGRLKSVNVNIDSAY